VKRARPVIVGALPREALDVVLARAESLGAPAAVLGRDFAAAIHRADLDGIAFSYRDAAGELDAALPAVGAHHAHNAALAIACARALGRRDADAIRAGLASATLPGRVEIVARAPWLVVDGAHTAASARALADALGALPRTRSHFVLSISAGKDLAAILGALVPLADRITLTRAEPKRSLDPAEIAAATRAARPGVDLRVVPNPHLALRAAREDAAPSDLVVATGSVYLAGIARRLWIDGVTRA